MPRKLKSLVARTLTGWGAVILTLVVAVFLVGRSFEDSPRAAPKTSPRPAPPPIPRMSPPPAAGDAESEGIARYFEQRIPDYPNTTLFRLGEALEAGGVPMKAAWGTTRDSVDQVLGFYKNDLLRQGLQPNRRDYKDGSAMVSAVDGQRGHVISVMAVPRPDGDVEIRPSLADISVSQFSFGAPEDLPFVPGSGGFFTTSSDDPGRVGKTVQSVNWAKLHENADFYRRTLHDRGWKLVTEKTSPLEGSKAVNLRFERVANHEEIQVHLEPLSTESGTSVFLTYSRQTAPGEP